MFRWLSLAVFVGALVTSGYYRWQARQGSETIPRRREGCPLLAFRALVALPLFLLVIANVVSPDRMNWGVMLVPAWVRWLGLAIGALTIPSVSWVLRSLGRNVSETVLTKHEHELVTVGPYRWIRHPLYTTGITLFFALGAMQASWAVLLFASFVALLIRVVVIPMEERELLAKFDGRYRSYMTETGALLPRISGMRHAASIGLPR